MIDVNSNFSSRMLLRLVVLGLVVLAIVFANIAFFRNLLLTFSGQDGAYLSRFLLDRGYLVHVVSAQRCAAQLKSVPDEFEKRSITY